MKCGDDLAQPDIDLRLQRWRRFPAAHLRKKSPGRSDPGDSEPVRYGYNLIRASGLSPPSYPHGPENRTHEPELSEGRA